MKVSTLAIIVMQWNPIETKFQGNDKKMLANNESLL